MVWVEVVVVGVVVGCELGGLWGLGVLLEWVGFFEEGGGLEEEGYASFVGAECFGVLGGGGG